MGGLVALVMAEEPRTRKNWKGQDEKLSPYSTVLAPVKHKLDVALEVPS